MFLVLRLGLAAQVDSHWWNLMPLHKEKNNKNTQKKCKNVKSFKGNQNPTVKTLIKCYKAKLVVIMTL